MAGSESSDISDSDADLYSHDEGPEIFGMRLVPIDLVTEHVRSKGIQFFVALLVLYRFAAMFVLSGSSSTSCMGGRAVNMCIQDEGNPSSYVSEDGYSMETMNLVLAATLLLVIGSLNSKYLVRECGSAKSRTQPWIIWVIKVTSLLGVSSVIYLAQIDLQWCSGQDGSPHEYCLTSQATSGDEMGMFIHNSLTKELTTVTSLMLSQNNWILEKACNKTVTNILSSWSTRSDDCGTLEEDSRKCMESTNEYWSCTCMEIGECYFRYKNKVATTTTTYVYFVLLLGLIAASLWDVLSPFVPSHIVPKVRSLQWFCAPFVLSAVLSVLLGFDWCVSQAWGWGTNSVRSVMIALSIFAADDVAEQGFLWNAGIVLFLLQFIVMMLASSYNFYKYTKHMAILSKIHWAYFDMTGEKKDTEHGEETTTEVLQEAEAQDLSISKVRESNWLYMSWYFGLSWASMMVGSFLVALFLTSGMIMIYVLVAIPKLRISVWNSFFKKIIGTIVALVFLQTTFSVFSRCLWGSGRSFPRRPAMLANVNLVMLLLSLQASLLLALSRFIKSIIPATGGMMVVTFTMTSSPLTFLKDSMVGYYMASLKLERYQMALENGEIKEGNPKLDCKTHVQDTVWTLGILLVVAMALIVGTGLTAMLFGVSAEQAFREASAAPFKAFSR